ncbi:TRL domain-containing protein [Citrobacter sp. Cb031]|uniref:TRL domain-containing protein n=1 Tax=Citrobacter sp. Cb031 TaxID=2985025 RepID=UPI00336A96BF
MKGSVTTDGETGSKNGIACSESKLELVNTGDASFTTVTQNGTIETLASVHYKTQVLILSVEKLVCRLLVAKALN